MNNEVVYKYRYLKYTFGVSAKWVRVVIFQGKLLPNCKVPLKNFLSTRSKNNLLIVPNYASIMR